VSLEFGRRIARAGRLIVAPLLAVDLGRSCKFPALRPFLSTPGLAVRLRFIDTDYDGQSFFVRHADFLYGGKDTKEGPYDKLRKALRAEIDEGEWSKLYSATSQPFDPPRSRNIAVKVINHFGDEVLKVYPLSRHSI
jgi:hypothetical protein